MRKFLLTTAFICVSGIAQAQLVQQTKPPSVNGFGTLAVTNASTLLSTLTPGPNSSVYPATSFPNGAVTIKSSPLSSGNVWVCPLGGTCSATVGIPIAVGGVESYTITNSAVTTVIATTTATIIAEW